MRHPRPLGDPVDPGRDLGRTDLHRIRPADGQGAPRFAAIAPQLVDLLRGWVVVSHNASCDTCSVWEKELRGVGLAPWSGVTRRVKLVVAADVPSRSGKARKAHDYGIPIVDESTLMRLMGSVGARSITACDRLG
ncbi:hypothetical protein [Cryobacterium sp.]|uniref:3'-5' exonuclease n=1 Tax=Cryobacterium sp. TaxID=1926290 RepID=UPI002629272D|nr:hypothetical protein [Cryobacterium sp.]MCU1445094.1 polymerase subunit epsilon [Cryobacterium sp.]